jgi:hypothetical protein
VRRDDRAQRALPLDVLPAGSLRRGDAFLEPVTGEACVVAARFVEGERLLLACAGEDGSLRRVRVHPGDPLRVPA